MSEQGREDSPRKRKSLPPAGTLIRQTTLGTEAIYRVVAVRARGVEVEVVNAPGLERGARFVFSAEAVIAMVTVETAGGTMRSHRAEEPLVDPLERTPGLGEAR